MEDSFGRAFKCVPSVSIIIVTDFETQIFLFKINCKYIKVIMTKNHSRYYFYAVLGFRYFYPNYSVLNDPLKVLTFRKLNIINILK